MPEVIYRPTSVCADPGFFLKGLAYLGSANGGALRAITLPDDICAPIGKAMLDELVARGLAVKGPTLQPGDQ